MKLKGLTKLALSGVALAAVAATLGTSTYAWYISNTTATVTGAEGSTAQADTSGSLYAASYSMHEEDMWSNQVVLAGGATLGSTVDYIAVNNLTPVTKATTANTTAYKGKLTTAQLTEFTDPTAGTFVDKTGKAVASGAYLEFSVWLIQRGDANKAVAPKLTITNETADVTVGTQTAYSSNNLPDKNASGALDPALKAGDSFKVDAVHAMRVEISNSAAWTTSAATTAVSTTEYVADRDFEAYTTKTGMVNGGHANQYYNSVVKGVNLYGCAAGTDGNLCVDVDPSATANKWGNFWLKPNTETEITFKVWIEGTDSQCFDSCVSQTFKFGLEFALVK